MHAHTHELTDGWTDRRDVGNSILDGKLGIPEKTSTLLSVSTLKSGINVLVGKFVKINKRTGWNKRTGGKIEPKYCLIILILLVNFLLSFEF